jgi:hypothetical protein
MKNFPKSFPSKLLRKECDICPIILITELLFKILSDYKLIIKSF